MSNTIKGSINLSKIDKEKLFAGKKGTYLDIVLIKTPNGKYYEWMIVQDTPKEEESIIIGNAGKIFTEMQEPTEQSPNQEKDSPLPF